MLDRFWILEKEIIKGEKCLMRKLELPTVSGKFMTRVMIVSQGKYCKTLYFQVRSMIALLIYPGVCSMYKHIFSNSSIYQLFPNLFQISFFCTLQKISIFLSLGGQILRKNYFDFHELFHHGKSLEELKSNNHLR